MWPLTQLLQAGVDGERNFQLGFFESLKIEVELILLFRHSTCMP